MPRGDSAAFEAAALGASAPSGPSKTAMSGPSDSPASRPQFRWRHGTASTMSSTVDPARTRVVIRLGPNPATIRRIRCAENRMRKRCRCAVPGLPGREVRSPDRSAISTADERDSARYPGSRSDTVTAGRGK